MYLLLLDLLTCIVDVRKEIEEYLATGKFGVPVTANDYLALGLEIPEFVMQFDRFVIQHSLQLETMGLPRSLWNRAFEKLRTEIFDGGSVFELQYPH